MADETDPRKGFTVSEIETKIKQYGIEICLCAMFLLSAIFALVWGGMMLLWAILLPMILGVVGVLLPKFAHKTLTSALQFARKEKVTSIILAAVGILVSLLLPPLVFAIVGLAAGKALITDATSCSLDPKD